MKTIFTTYIICLALIIPFKSLQAQDVSVGTGINFLMGSSTQSFGFGLNLVNEYQAFQKYGLRLHASFILAGLSRVNEYEWSDSYSLSSFESSFIYYPTKSSTEPYIGIGAGYYMPNSSNTSNAGFLSTGESIFGNHIDNSFGMNFLAGMKFSAQRFVSYNIELKYIYLKTDWSAHISGPKGDYEKDLGKINLSTLIFNFSFIFNF